MSSEIKCKIVTVRILLTFCSNIKECPLQLILTHLHTCTQSFDGLFNKLPFKSVIKITVIILILSYQVSTFMPGDR